MTIEVVAGTYGVMMSLAPLLQIRKMRKNRSSVDVSLLYLTVLVIGFVRYFAYGVSISNRLLIVKNIASFVVTSLTLATATLYRSRSGKELQ